MIQLREYQQKFVTDIKSKLANSRSIIACSATGSGKTKTFLSIADNAVLKGTTTLIISESRKIFTQIAKERKCYEIKAGIKHLWLEPGCMYLAMAQTLAKREFIIKQFQQLGSKLLIINDEAHVGTSTKLLLQFKDAYIIGFTATPDYKVAKHLPKIYNDIVVGAQPQELVEMGFLSPYFHYEKKEANLSDLQKDSKGEYTEQSQYNAFAGTKVFAGLHEDLRRFDFKKCIIFCSSIKHCSTLSEDLKSQGYDIAEVHTMNPKADFELSEFMYGDVKICVSVGILTKGFDFPDIDLVVLQRATTSLALYCQMVGRGSRITPNKSRFIVLDYGGNATRHGLWNYEHDWSKKWTGKEKKKKDGIAPVKECPKCFLLVSSKSIECPECGHKWTSKEKEFVEGKLIEVTSKYNELRGKRISELTPEQLAIYRNITNKKAFTLRVAKAKGLEFLKEFGRIVGYNPYFISHQDINEKIEFFDITIK